jgi:SAM-dependent methyltransferase
VDRRMNSVGSVRGAQILAACLMAICLSLTFSGGASGSSTLAKEAGAIQAGGKESREGPKLDVPYEPTTYEIAEEMIRMADVQRDDLVYDLGCGDGRIVIMAVKEKGARGVGVDLDPKRIRESIANARAAGIGGRVRFFRQDLFRTDIRAATVVMLYLWPEVNLRLRPRLFAQLKPGTRIVSHSHKMGDWQPDQVSEASNHNLYAWTIPANVTGVWTWLMSLGGVERRVVLRFNQHFQEINGSVAIDGSVSSIAGPSIKGDRIRLIAEPEVGGSRMTMTFDGRVDGDTIHGTILGSGGNRNEVPWLAERDPSSRVVLDN